MALTACLPDTETQPRAAATGAAKPEQAVSAPYPDLPAPTLRIQGSNTIGANLASALAKQFLIESGAANVRASRGDRENEQFVRGTLSDGRPIQISIAAHGSSTGFAALLEGTADMAASSRRIKAKEVSALSFLGDFTSMDAEHVLGIDGLAIIVHPSNPLTRLSLEQIRQVFSGTITDWSTLGGSPGAIRVLARDNQSGTYDTFKHLVLTGDTQLTLDAQRYESNDVLAQDVADDPRAIGFAALASAQVARIIGVSDGDTVALRPDRLAVATEDYPLTRRLYFYIAPADKNPLVRDFINFALSPDGQQVVEKIGFIPQVPQAVDVSFTPYDPPAFRWLTEGAQRLSVSFRFQSDSRELDNKALRDVQRLVDYVERAKLNPSRLMLIGFSEQRSDELGAQILSEYRASTVQKALGKQGLDVQAVTGYGHYRLVSSAQSLQASQRNSRVEVWLREE